MDHFCSELSTRCVLLPFLFDCGDVDTEIGCDCIAEMRMAHRRMTEEKRAIELDANDFVVKNVSCFWVFL